MRALYLLRHSLTEANERRLYCGSTDLPLSPGGRELASERGTNRPLPVCDRYITSGMARADETLALLARRSPDCVLPALREMDFGRFEMKGYDELRHDADYVRWIEDESGAFPCPGGESSAAFRSRVRLGGVALLEMAWDSALVVCHGGAVVQLMQAWFPDEPRHFYQWQPPACGGWRVTFDGKTPVGFEEL